MKNNRSKLERKLDEVNHTMELIRTIVPVIIFVDQLIILTLILNITQKQDHLDRKKFMELFKEEFIKILGKKVFISISKKLILLELQLAAV